MSSDRTTPASPIIQVKTNRIEALARGIARTVFPDDIRRSDNLEDLLIEFGREIQRPIGRRPLMTKPRRV